MISKIVSYFQVLLPIYESTLERCYNAGYLHAAKTACRDNHIDDGLCYALRAHLGLENAIDILHPLKPVGVPNSYWWETPSMAETTRELCELLKLRIEFMRTYVEENYDLPSD